ncbi:MAG: DUF6465 family protein [Saccharofermentans sp.]|nr:DUF6465 family protein [Saccharofermentans sp.]
MAKTTKKETAKVVEAPKAEVKAEVKAAAPVAEKKVAEKKAPVAKKEAPAKKAAPAAKKPAAKKAPAKKVAPATIKTVEIQLGEQSISYDAIIKKVVKAAKGAKVVDAYVKVDENKIYYVADKNETQSIDLF